MEVEIDKQYWTMVGKRPMQLTCFKKYELKPMFGTPYIKVLLLNHHTNTLYERIEAEIFQTYEELRDHVFPQRKE